MANTYTEESGIVLIDTPLEQMPAHIQKLLGLLNLRTEDNPWPNLPATGGGQSMVFTQHSEGDSIHPEDDAVYEAFTDCAIAAGADSQEAEAASIAELLEMTFGETEHAEFARNQAKLMDDASNLEPTMLLDITMRAPGGQCVRGYLAQHGYYGDRLDLFSAGGSCHMALRKVDGTIHREDFNPRTRMLSTYRELASGADSKARSADAPPRVVLHIRGGAVQTAWASLAGMQLELHDEDLLEEFPALQMEAALAAASQGLHATEVLQSPALRAEIAAWQQASCDEEGAAAAVPRG